MNKDSRETKGDRDGPGAAGTDCRDPGGAPFRVPTWQVDPDPANDRMASRTTVRSTDAPTDGTTGRTGRLPRPLRRPRPLTRPLGLTPPLSLARPLYLARPLTLSLAFALALLPGLSGLPARDAFAQSAPGSSLLAPDDTTVRLPRSEASDDPDASPIWQKVRMGLFQSRPIITGSGDVVTLESPARAEDAAVVPIAIRAHFDQSEARHIQRLYLIVDRNPSPVSAIFHLTTLSGRADIETRIRIEDYSFIRAVAELNDGSLHMATRFIKASGGCSAPAGRDMAQAKANLGRWRMRVEGETQAGKPALAQLMISHPNESGLAMDQVSRSYATPHFVRQVEVTYAGEPVLTADIDFSISENPNFRFYFTPRDDAGRLEVHFVDNQDLAFDGAIVVPGAGVAAAPADARR